MRFVRSNLATLTVTTIFLFALVIGVLAAGNAGSLQDGSLHLQSGDNLQPELDLRYAVGAKATVYSGNQYLLSSVQQAGRNVYNGDLVVLPGEKIAGDAIVYDGDVTVQSEGRVSGDLIVYSGDVLIDAGASIDGNVAAFSGDVAISGMVAGDIASWSGDVEIGSSGRVDGDISVLSGNVTQQEGAVVNGNVVRGPSLRFPISPGRPFLFDIGPDFPGAAGLAAAPTTIWDRMGRLLVRLLGASLLAVLLGLLASALVYVRPELVDNTFGVIRAQTALSFVVGLLTNLVLLILGILLTITLCLIPVALIPLLVLFAINLVGITAMARTVGQRLSRQFYYSADPALYAGVGTLVFVGLIGVLFALGTCFQLVGAVVLLIVGSLGSGGVLLPWLQKYSMQTEVATEPIQPIEPEVDEVDSPAEEEVERDSPRLDEGPEKLPDDAAPRTEESPLLPDDFTVIAGIGPVFDQRLKSAGILTFEQLANLSAEEIADAIGWSAWRVERSNIIQQARDLASS